MTPSQSKDLARRLYRMELGEETPFYGVGLAVRVPGGWIIGGVFVPYHNEFQPQGSY